MNRTPTIVWRTWLMNAASMVACAVEGVVVYRAGWPNGVLFAVPILIFILSLYFGVMAVWLAATHNAYRKVLNEVSERSGLYVVDGDSADAERSGS